jgi:hypothetical protein
MTFKLTSDKLVIFRECSNQTRHLIAEIERTQKTTIRVAIKPSSTDGDSGNSARVLLCWTRFGVAAVILIIQIWNYVS